MNLGTLIETLKLEDPKKILKNGFGAPHSYRGYYDQLAFEPKQNISVGDMLVAAQHALGATYEGYKGGDYTMLANTEVWVAPYGECSDSPLSKKLLEYMLADVVDGPSRSPLFTQDPTKKENLTLAEAVSFGELIKRASWDIFVDPKNIALKLEDAIATDWMVESDFSKYNRAVRRDLETMLKAGCRFEVRRDPQAENAYAPQWLVLIDPNSARDKQKPEVSDLIQIAKFWHQDLAEWYAHSFNNRESYRTTL